MAGKTIDRCGLTLGLAAMSLLTLAPTVDALEMHPPWIRHQHEPKSPDCPPWVGHTHQKRKSPYYPPWIGCESHQQELARDGVWAYPLDWREVDWSQATSGRRLHESTQAVSLWVDRKLRGDCPPEPKQDPILEYYRFPPTTGPGRQTK